MSLRISNNENGGVVLVSQATYFPFSGNTFPAPVDNRGSIYSTLVPDAPYAGYPSVGNVVFSAVLSNNNGNMTISIKKISVPSGEITVNAIHIPNGTKVIAAQRTLGAAGSGLQRSGSVTTSGPAVLVAWWWGEGSTGTTHVATPGNGFQIVQALTADLPIAQCTVAVRTVNAAGTYQATWISGAQESAMLALVAVE
jgi:hypothetical protein